MAAMAKAVSILFLILCLLLFSFTPPRVNAQTLTRSYLTEEILQKKASNLIQQEGRDTISLSNYIIDLTRSDSEFNRYFYQEINNTISRVGNPINLDFSNSIIQGDFQLNQLGIASSLGEGALPSLFTTEEQANIYQYYPLKITALTQIPLVNIFRGSLYFNNTVFTGNVNSSNSLYLQPIIANTSIFQGTVNFNRTNFGKAVDFGNTIFNQNINLSHSHFFAQAKFNQAEFKGINDFSNSQFEASTNFSNAVFNQLTDFTRNVFVEMVDFSQAIFRDRLIFTKSKFLNSILLTNTTLEKTSTFRDIYLNSLINLQDAHLLNRLDFSNAFFTPQANINLSGLAFDASEAQIIGQPGIIGKLINLNRLQGNETVFRNLIRNFRSLEQIADANYLEYQQQQLKVQEIGDRLTKTSWRKVFTWAWISLIPKWLSLSLLLLLGDYGTNINLIFSLGIITIAFFSLIYWLIDRYRPNISQPVIPKRYEIIFMLLSYFILTIFSILNIFITTDQPLLTLIAIAIVLIPLPILIVGIIYQRGRYHQLLNTTYFVENGEYREFRLFLGRLPIIPRFPFYRDRYMPILWDKRWSWLNYYDFSLINIFKLGFNDIRLRDRHLPGLISCLVWYQWCLGVLYIVLLLWTLSRTIPGLNLLIYF
jgi:hypothetical protein